ncbi:hypothetical protein AB0I55_25490 [Actinocatenispora sera]|uniref:hypothetical protein n=1 Tax=Actinocatenispora sera TaxID=390989 RepID=UPI0033C59827
MSRSVVSSRSPRLRRFTRRGALALVAGVGAAAVLAGCGAGQISETAKIQPAVQGANAQSDSGTIALRDLTVLFRGDGDATYTAGQDAPLVTRIANSGADDDVLTSVSTNAAESVVFVDSSASASASPSDSASPSGTASPSGSASPTPNDQPPGPDRFDLKVASQDLLTLLPDQGKYLELYKVRRDLRPGQTVRLVFHFQKAGDIQIDVPMAPPEKVTERSPAGVEHPEEG